MSFSYTTEIEWDPEPFTDSREKAVSYIPYNSRVETGALGHSSPSDLVCINYKFVICIKLKRGLAKVPELANSSICEVLYPHTDINLHNKLDVGIIIRKPYFTDMEIEALAQTGISNARLHTFLCKLFN